MNLYSLYTFSRLLWLDLKQIVLPVAAGEK